MTTIDHQQAAVRAGAEAIMRAGGLERFLGTSGLYNLPVWLRAKRDSENALTAATPHLRAAWEQPIRELHRPVEIEPSDTVCRECSFQLPNGHFFGKVVDWPCPTIALLEGGA